MSAQARRRRHNQRGASAVVLSLVMMVLIAAGALGFDIAKLVYERQQVRAAVDAAAQIGAARLTSTAMGTSAAADMVALIKSAAVANYGTATYGPKLTTANVTVAFYCVVANTSGSSAVVSPNTNQIPSTCRPNPSSTDYTTGTKCSGTSCAIPCSPTTIAGAVCNAVQVSASKTVQFVFGPAINIDHGSAAASTVSCRGSCGGEATPNPMNVVVMADRTPSMWGTLTSVNSSTGKVTGTGNDSNLSALRSGIEGMLQIMTPNQQYVAFGALHQSTTVTNTSAADNLTKPLASGGKIFGETTSTSYTYSNQVTGTTYNSQTKCEKYSYYWYNSACYKTRTTVTTAARTNQFAGTWVPVGFTKTYLNSDKSLNTSTDLYASVHNLAYSNLTTSGTNGSSATYFWNSQLGDDGTYSNAGTGTHLASALKGAARYLLANVDSNNYVSSLDSDGFRADLKIPVRNVIIFETDGQPDEVFTDASTDAATPLALTNADDIGSTDDYRACQNFKKVADEVKAAGILMVTIGFGSVNSASCSNSSGSSATARSVLAYAASTNTSVTGTGTADSTCSNSTQIAAENSDSDYYYCAASASDLTSVFAAAMGNISKNTKFMAIDGVSD
ncbi:MAG: pilus assembly protein [Propionicimonas sp.]|uniref:TadE/TadG family type IV pilus assembly protein n=1 Tax=Propionicimonas sp. TaxID=1955623 RepID=UPI003D0DC6A5